VIATIRRLLALSSPPRARVAISIVLGALAVIFGIGLMATAGWLIARAAQKPDVLELTVGIVLVRFFGLARPIARYLERLSSHDVAFRALAGIRTRFFERIEPLAPAELSAFRSGDLLSRMVGDVDALQNLYLRGLAPPAIALIAGVAAVTAAAVVLPVAGVVLAVGLLVSAVFVPLTGAAAGRSVRATAQARGELSAEVVELLRSAPELVVHGAEAGTLARVGAADARVAALSRREGVVAGATDGLGVAITGVTVAAVLAVAVSAHSSGTISGVWVATLGLLALASFESVAALPQAGRELSSTLAAGRRVLDLTDRRPRVTEPETALPPPSSQPRLALDAVTAGYGDEPSVVHDLSLVLEPGRRIALVGPSGAGKTTVVNLLLRFLDPREGAVLLDGRDLRDYRLEDVRGAMAVAGQDSHMFATSIRENVKLARPGASDADIVAALRGARIDEWVASLPQGLDTMTGEEGAELSGGQRQRIAIARALLADAPILVLDEPTAHLDAETAQRLMADVLDATSGRSLLLITHRPEGLDRMDQIITLT
jgi:thiol reductant ABC exporter CydC subunit